MNEETINCFLCGGSHLLNVCPEPAIKSTWEEILGQVNEEDIEAVDYDEVGLFLEHDVHDLMIIAVSVQYGGGIPTEDRHVHINRIIRAVRNHMNEYRLRSQCAHSDRCLVQVIEEDDVDTGVLDCPICYDEIEYRRIAMLGCRHEFCRPCLEKHIEKNKLNCPMCRGEIQHITVRQSEDYVAICELAARTSVPAVAPLEHFDDDDIPRNLYILPPNYPIHENDINMIYNNFDNISLQNII